MDNPTVDAGIGQIASPKPPETSVSRKRAPTSDDILALKKCDDALSALDDAAAQDRIASWLIAKYGRPVAIN